MNHSTVNLGSRYLYCSGLIIATLLLGACGSNDDQDELQRYVDNVKSRKAYSIEPIPKLVVSEKFAYPLLQERDPFMPALAKKDTGVNAPDQMRPKQPLEAFALDSLRMVGLLKQNVETWAVVSAPDGTVYRVREGSFIGKNYGKITGISPGALRLEEMVQQNGIWEKRSAKLALVEGE